MSEVINNLPVIALRGMTILPYMVIHFDISRKKSISAVEYAMVHGQRLFVTTEVLQEGAEKETDSYCEIGIMVEIKQIMKMPNNLIRVLVRGVERGRILGFVPDEKRIMANVELIAEDETELDDITQTALARTLKDAVKRYAADNAKLNKDTVTRIMAVSGLRELIYRVVAELPMETEKKIDILAEETLYGRFKLTNDAIKRELEIAKIRKDFMSEVRENIDKHQKEYVLREQMRLIREELGDSGESEIEEFLKKTEGLNASDEVKNKLKKEIGRYKNMSPSSAEANVIRSYIETLLDMPWNNASEDNNSIVNAKKVLDSDHYGLEKVKERILEFLAVRSLNSKGEAPVICLVGPPGTGKTSIAASVAKALNKKYVRICLGGVRDEAEIRGHRKTYVGAMPGRIIEGIKTAKVKNPLMLLDEIDKTGKDSRGDTASALLEVLDGAQNSRFMDHYMEVPVDLSEVLFIATANDASAIPRPLYDRMEIIELSSYTENEKLHIAKDYLVRKQLEKNGLTKKELSIADSALTAVIRGYTREAGVRNLERKIGSICRVTAKKLLSEELPAGKTVKVNSKNIKDFLGREKYKEDKADNKSEVGVVTGLAWTSVGGDTLAIEVNVMPGKGEMILTGKMGDVMKESARIALTYVRSVAADYGVEDEFFSKHDLHIHIPEGAVPKDGPSAGITMSTALLSAVSGIPVKEKLAMTGEVTLRGRVLPIGGLKEKLLAASAYGIKEVLVPVKNIPDVEELDEEITKNLNIHYVENMKQVIEHSFVRK